MTTILNALSRAPSFVAVLGLCCNTALAGFSDFNDASVWTPYFEGSGPTIINNVENGFSVDLPADSHGGTPITIVGYTSSPYDLGAGYLSTFSVQGDFSMVADYTLNTWPPGGNGVNVGIWCYPWYSTARTGCFWTQGADGDGYFFQAGQAAGTTFVSTTDLSGTLRLDRVGTALSGYYRDASGNWVQIGSGSVSAQDFQVSLQAWSREGFFQGEHVNVSFSDIEITAQGFLTPEGPKPEPQPTIKCPTEVTQSNDPDQCGAVVTYPDPVVIGTPEAATCSPASGSFFPLGGTVVTCSTHDSDGNVLSCDFTITINDTQTPAIVCAPDLTVPATSAAGAVVTYPGLTVSDNCPEVAANCSPTSGSAFPIGSTTVACATSDAAGNAATCSFTVHVKGGAEQVSDLAAYIGALPISGGIKNSLVAKLPNELCGPLQALINEAKAQRGKKLAADQADQIIAQAIQIRAVLGCP